MHVKDQWKTVMDGRLGTLLLILGMLLTHAQASAAPLPKPTHTKFTKFRIPFTFDAASFQRMNAKEIQLHVSRDHGASWELAQTMTPEGGKFVYAANSDGEYWFSVKTVDGRNQVHPPNGSYETGLIVIVDTKSPVLDMTLQQAADGKVQLSWKATDSNLDASTLRFEYLAPESQNWEPVVVALQSRGDATWPVEQNGLVMVRGSISDFAGNVGQVQDQINVGGARGLKLRHRVPIASSPSDDVASTVGRASLSTMPSTDGSADDLDHQGPIITPMGRPPQYSPASEGSSPFRDRWSNASFPSSQSGSADINRASPASNRDSIRQSQSTDQQVAHRQPSNRRGAPRQRIVNTRHFQLGYALADVGPSGVSAVELFITEDNGRKWWKYGDDPDQKSPFDVEVPRDGVYGFTIRARSGVGRSEGPPVANELPETVIAVDSTAPVVELLPIEQGRGTNINKLRIRWKIIEDHPADLPVSVEYAANPNGPWTPINGWREDNNHQLDWTVGPSVPSQFYLRVVARDVAGNMGKAESQAPIVIDLGQPVARIVDVEVTPIPRAQE